MNKLNTHYVSDSDYFPFGSKKTEVRVFGRNGGATNWKALLGLTGKIVKKTARKGMEVTISLYAKNAEVTKLIVPSTGEFNALVGEHDEARDEIRLSPRVSIFRGLVAEGVVLPRKMACLFFPADCNIIVARSDSGRVITAHAGGFSLIDHLGAVSGVPHSRKYPSVVDAVIDRFGESGDVPSSLSVFVVQGVGSSDFGYNPKDPIFGERNRKILDAFKAIDSSVVVGANGGVDITRVIRLQFEKRGVLGNRIQTDSTDTVNDRDHSDFVWWSHERAKREGNDEEATECRNLVMVIN